MERDTQLLEKDVIETFALGRLAATQGVLNAVTREELRGFIERHTSRDWGDCTPEDREANDRAVWSKHGGRLLSVYHTAAGVKVWVITEADRRSTTVLLPTEY